MPRPATSATLEVQPSMPATHGRGRWHGLAVGVGSGFLLWLAFPPGGRADLAWFALAPLFTLVRSQAPRWSTYLGAWLGGLTFWLLAVQWVRYTDPSAWLGWIALASYLSLYWPTFLLIARWIDRRGTLPLILVAPLVWVALEYLQAHALTGLPWFHLAHSQFRFVELIQIADLTGVWGISLLVAAVNALLAEAYLWWSRRGTVPNVRALVIRAALVAVLLLASLGYGLLRVRTAEFRPGPRIALLQSNFRQEIKSALTADEVLTAFYELTRRSYDSEPDLIVWPETSFPYYHSRIDPSISDQELASLARQMDAKLTAAEARRREPVIRDMLHALANLARIPTLVGTTYVDYRPGSRTKFNSAILFEPGSDREQRYDKLHLVPFGEYVPLLETFPFLTRLTPYQGDFIPSLAPGAGPRWIEVGPWRFATAICFEDSVPHVVRRSFAETRDRRQPDVLLNLSNDGWFHGSAELDMHLAVSTFRAVEHRVPIARAVNTGISAVIDGNGRIRHQLPKETANVLSEIVPLDDRTTLYTRAGDWLPAVLWGVTGTLFGASLVRFPRPPNQPICPTGPDGVD